MMERCRTCVHWASPNKTTQWDEIIVPYDEDTYQPKEMPFEVRRCEHPAKTFCERPVEKDGFGLSDGSGFKAHLYTAEDFGCVRHESA